MTPTPFFRFQPRVRSSASAFALSALSVALSVALVSASVVATPAFAQSSPAARAAAPRTGDYIVAVVNQELVTAGEVQQRLERVIADAKQRNAQLPSREQLSRDVLQLMVDERVLVTHARTAGQKVDDVELDRALNNIATQNQLSPAQLRDRLRAEGIDYTRFRNNIRDQILVERVREREVQSRIRVSEEDVDNFLKRERGTQGAAPVQYNVAQVLVVVPENASEAVVTERRARAEAALARVRGGTSFETVAREMSDDSNRANGGEIGLRPADRLPDLFMNAVRDLKPGDTAGTVLRSPAGFHVLKLVQKVEGDATVTQTRVRHILLRTGPQLTPEVAGRRLAAMKKQIESGARTFEQLARENSQDGSAAQGGELGWVGLGALVPEFEQAMNALPLNGLSDPVVSRFGVHLIQVTERRQVALDPKQLREQARNELREQKFEAAYDEWLNELRARAYIEFREPPQ